MKTFFFLSALFFVNGAQAETCVVVARNGDNLAFEQARGRIDEYAALQQKSERGINFIYLEGHGMRRLAAYQNGRLIAATYSSDASALNLEARGVQAGCADLD